MEVCRDRLTIDRRVCIPYIHTPRVVRLSRCCGQRQRQRLGPEQAARVAALRIFSLVVLLYTIYYIACYNAI